MLYQLSYTPKGNDENAGRQACRRNGSSPEAGSFSKGAAEGQAEGDVGGE